MSVQPQPIGLAPSDVAALETLIDEWINLCLDRNWDGLLDLLTDDVVFMPPGEPMVSGKHDIESWLGEFPVMTEFSSSVSHIDGRADMAALRGSFDMTVDAGEGEMARLVGKWMATYRKEGGHWRCVTDCWNLDSPT